MDDSASPHLEVHEITFDAMDPHRLATFWAHLLEREVRPGDMPADDSVLVVERAGQPGLLFLRVPESKTAKNRVHFDLWPTATTRDVEVERALRLGATLLADRRQPGGPGWAVLADPEGNEFCIGSSATERKARRAGRSGTPDSERESATVAVRTACETAGCLPVDVIDIPSAGRGKMGSSKLQSDIAVLPPWGVVRSRSVSPDRCGPMRGERSWTAYIRVSYAAAAGPSWPAPQPW